MIEIRKILCPIDFSDFSRRALDHAVAIARRYESTITVMHVYAVASVAAYGPEPLAFPPIVLTSADRAEILGELRRFADAESAPGIAIDTVIAEGPAAAEILNQEAALNADLLVMGTHGRSGFERLLLGSVAEKVLRKAACPVLTVPRRLPDAVPAAPVLFKQILCPVDFSDCSMHALKYALSMAQEGDGCLTIAHVLTSDLPHDAPDDDRTLTLAALERQRETASRQRLKEAVPETASTYCRVESLTVSGKPSREILRIASKRQTDLIVMGVHGRGAADIMFFGSTTQHVVREAPCPVLTIRRT